MHAFDNDSTVSYFYFVSCFCSITFNSLYNLQFIISLAVSRDFRKVLLTWAPHEQPEKIFAKNLRDRVVIFYADTW